VPDGGVFDVASGWCVLIESKVLAALSVAQLARHRRTAERLGFKTIRAVAIVLGRGALRPSGKDLLILRWSEIYRCLVRCRARPLAAKAAEYLEIVESRLIEEKKFAEGTLTMFAGFPFRLSL
jgi:hypothetical protein